MRDYNVFDKIDLHLIRVLYTVLTERSVCRAAVRLGMRQSALSSALKHWRDFAGHPLLVRLGSLMVPAAASWLQARLASSLLILTPGRQYCERLVATPLKRH